MLTILIRTLILYFFLFFIMRLMGKRQIGELEVTDLVTTLLLSEIASLPITNQEIPLSYAIIPMILLLFLEIFFAVILIRFPKLKGLVSARPTVIIHQGQLDQSALGDLRISIDELMSEVRQQGITDLSQVQYAILEKNGKLTVLPYSIYAQPTAQQLGLAPSNDGLMHIVYSNRSYSESGLKLIGKSKAWLEDELKKRGVRPESLFCATANENGDLYLIPKEEKA